jgi:hypothetical protein
MAAKSLTLCLTTFLALTYTLPAFTHPQEAPNTHWTVKWWQNAMNCQGNPDESTIDVGTTECLPVPFAPESFEFVSAENPSQNIRMCLDPECGECQELGPNRCWSLESTGRKGVTYQIVTA